MNNRDESIERNATFVSDAPFYKDADVVYTYGGFPYSTWLRYLQIFSSLEVVGRESIVKPLKNVISSGQGVSFHLVQVPGKLGWLLKRRTVVSSVSNALEKTDYAIIRVPTTMGQIAIDICEKSKRPYVLEVVGCPYDALLNHGSIFAKILAPWRRSKMKKQVANAKNVIYVTQQFLQTRYPNLHNNTNVSNVSIKDCIDLKEAESFYAQASDTLLIGMIGAFNVKYKGHLDALKAIEKIKKTKSLGKKVHLYMVGTGDYSWLQKEIRERGISSHVTLCGALPPGEKGIFPFLNKLHIFIQPSLTEGLPRTLIEAMSRGKVCIASNVGGIPELLDTQYLHQAGDWNDLSAKIIRFMENLDISSISSNLQNASKYLNNTLTERRTAFIKNAMKQSF